MKMGEQGTGGLESSGRTSNSRRLSEATSQSHEDQIKSQAVQAETPSVVVEAQEPSQSESPRNYLAPVTNPSLSRTSSSASSSSASENWTEKTHSHKSNKSRRAGSEARSSRHERLGLSGSSQHSSSQPLEPPVTKTTLSELDVNKIVHNPKLRHDINFDPELHFRPNLDGEKGKRKQDKANQFWTNMLEQLQQFVADPVKFQAQYGQSQDWSLPMLLKSVKEIIQTLVPARDRPQLDEGLNVELIMQQFNRGIADLEKLASWLSGVLKSHCAPMRDEWVDEMYNQLTTGNRENDMEELVRGMRSLLSVLEAMKLDVANHQIRCLRPILIEDTVHFEKRFFYKKITAHKMDPQPAYLWYNSANQMSELTPSERQTLGETAILFEAVAKMMMPSCSDSFPSTFIFDEERLSKLRSEVLDAVNLEVCMHLFERLEKEYRFYGASAALSAVATRSSSSSPSPGLMSLGLGEEEPLEFNFNAPSSRPASLVFSSAGSTNSSPRSSMILPSGFNPPMSAADLRSKSKNLHDSLVALLQSSPSSSRPGSKWKSMKDSLALQIFRYTDAPQDALLQIEEELEQHLSEERSDLFREVEAHYYKRLLAELQQRVRELKPHTAVGLFTVATGGRLQHGQGQPRTWNSHRDRSDGSQDPENLSDGLEDIATRLTHVTLLHWRVWAPLIYQGEAMDTEMTDSP